MLDDAFYDGIVATILIDACRERRLPRVGVKTHVQQRREQRKYGDNYEDENRC